MAKVELKQPVVEEISSKIKDAQSAVLVDARGLTVAQDTELRRALRKENVTYKVYKNTMMKRAFDGTDFAAFERPQCTCCICRGSGGTGACTLQIRKDSEGA